MSGQPNINATDASKFRQNYLANLALQASIDDKNLQANKVFKKTGQTPSQLIDFRTTSEKLADIERLKIDVRSSLNEIADGEQANAIVNQLSPEELVFLAQHSNEIINDIKPKYKYGVLADIFVPYFQKYIEKAIETNEVDYGLQQSAGRHIIMSIEQMLDDMVNPKMLERIRNDIMDSQHRLNQRLFEAIRKDIDELAKTIPTNDEMRRITLIQNAVMKRQIQEALSEALQELPTNTQVVQLMREFNKALERRDDDYIEFIGGQLHQLLSIQPATKEQMAMISQKLEELRKEKPEKSSGGAYAEEKPEPTSQEIIRRHYKPDSEFRAGKQVEDYITSLKEVLYPDSSRAEYYRKVFKTTKPNAFTLKAKIPEINQQLRELGDIQGSGIGISRMKGGSVRQQTDYSKGIMPKHKYVPLGRYFIDNHRLNNDIIALKRGNGCNVFGLPVQRVGKDVGTVLRAIVGGGQPQFHQLEKLSPEEKQYIHKIAKTTHILDRISIPTPNKDDDEKDINEFEVAKGEILSGNDSAELVKKFKMLIMKMVKKELLPKNQAKDILMDLVSLGY